MFACLVLFESAYEHQRIKKLSWIDFVLYHRQIDAIGKIIPFQHDTEGETTTENSIDLSTATATKVPNIDFVYTVY